MKNTTLNKSLYFFVLLIAIHLVIYNGTNKSVYASGRHDVSHKILNQAYQTANKITDVNSKANMLCKIAITYKNIGQQKDALKLLKQAQKTVLSENGKDKDQTLSIIANTYVKCDLYKQAEIIAKDVDKNVLSLNNFFTIMTEEYIKTGKYDQAFAIAQREGDSIYEIIACQYAKSHQWEQAFNTVNSIKNDSSKSSTLIFIANEYINVGQIEKASILLSDALTLTDSFNINNDEINKYDEKLRDTYHDLYIGSKVSALADIASVYYKAGQKDKATELFSDALQLADTMIVDTMRFMDISHICKLYIELGLYDKAVQIASTKFNDTLHKDKIFYYMAISYTKGKQYELAHDVIKSMDTEILKINALTEIAGLHADQGEKDNAKELLAEARQMMNLERKFITQYFKNTVLDIMSDGSVKSISVGYAKIGQYNTAINIANSIKRIDYKADALNEIADAVRKNEEKDKK